MLFVKNIPKKTTEEKIKSLHSGIVSVQLRSMKWTYNTPEKHQQQSVIAIFCCIETVIWLSTRGWKNLDYYFFTEKKHSGFLGVNLQMPDRILQIMMNT